MIDARAENPEPRAERSGPGHGLGAVPGSPLPGPAASAVPEVRIGLVTRVGCHLCEDARRVIERVSADLGVAWREIDADADPVTADAYGDRVPVILVDGREHGYWRVEEERLRRALAGDRWSWRPGRSAGAARSVGPRVPGTS